MMSNRSNKFTKGRQDVAPLPGDVKNCPACHRMTLVYCINGLTLKSITIKLGIYRSGSEEIWVSGDGWFCQCSYDEAIKGVND